MSEKMKWSGLYEAKVSDRHPILPKHISRFRRSFKIGDEIWLPVQHGEESFRPNYQSRCRVEEIHRDFLVVSHDGKWREAVNYVDFLTERSKIKVIMASEEMAKECDELTEKYWALNDLVYSGRTDLIKPLDEVNERLAVIEPLVNRRERFLGSMAKSQPLRGGLAWSALATKCKKELHA